MAVGEGHPPSLKLRRVKGTSNQQFNDSTTQRFKKYYAMEFEKSKVFDLAGSVAYSGDATVSKMVLKKQTGNITLFAFDAGQSLSEHSAPFDAYVLVTEGTGKIIINKKGYDLNAGQFIVMPANIPHAVQAVERFKMMLVMIKGD
jgi:quercetin dioxygenase-like cupin family protein